MQTIPTAGAPASEPAKARGRLALHLARALMVVVAIEVGLLLLTLPWTPLWDHSYWMMQLQPAHPALLQALLSPYLRGAVSGLGIINLWIAISEISHFRA